MQTIGKEILNNLINDNKERIILGISPFGDIYFKEKDREGKDVFFVCQNFSPTRPLDNPAQKGEFMFEVKIIALNLNEFKGFLRNGVFFRCIS